MENEKKILIIDDEMETAEIISDYLNDNGFLSKYKTDGRDIELIVNDFKPDLILCDVMMDHISGVDILHTLRHDLNTTNTPFIFISAKDDNESIINCLEAGANDYISKPFSFENLTERINYTLLKSQQNPIEKLRVLVADKSKVILKKTVDELKMRGFNVQGSSTISEVLEVLKDQTIDVIISGIKLTDDSGYNLCKKVKEFDASIVFLLLVSDGNSEAISIGNEVGMDDFILKKLGLEGVLFKLRKIKKNDKESILSFSIKKRNALDVMQSCEQKGFTGKIEIESENGNGYIEMKCGQYSQIVFGKLNDADALEALTNLTAGNIIIKQEQIVI